MCKSDLVQGKVNEKIKENMSVVYFTSADLEKASDRVNKVVSWPMLENYGKLGKVSGSILTKKIL